MATYRFQSRDPKPDARRARRSIAATSDSVDPNTITRSFARVIAVYKSSLLSARDSGGGSTTSATSNCEPWLCGAPSRRMRSVRDPTYVQSDLGVRHSELSDRRGIQSALGQRRSRKPDARRLSRLIAATSDSRDPRMITSSCARVIAVYNNSRVNT